MHHVLDRRDQPVRPRPTRAPLTDGRTALVVDHGDHVEIRPLPRVTVDEKAGRLLVEASPDDAERIAKRFEREHPDAGWGPARPGAATVTATVKYELSIETWPRFAAKVTLAAMSLLVDDSWLETDAAKHLQEVLWAGARQVHALLDPGWAWAAVPMPVNRATSPGNLLDGAEHLLCFESADGRAAVNVVVFGDLLYRVPLPVEHVPAVHPAWLLDPHERKVFTMPWAGLAYLLKARHLNRVRE
jgi:hypothetical protein